MLTCAYCGRDWNERDGACAHCGAPNKLAKLEKFNPFFYEGYIVYCLREWAYRSYSYIFYKGVTYIGRVNINDREIETWSPTMDPMPIILERLNAHSS